MYVNPQHRFTDREAIHALMAHHPLGGWVCHDREGLIANHLPWFLDRGRGPQAYTTPGWYPGKAAHGQVVPTWNYAVAHAHGVAQAIDDRGWLLDMLNRLADVHEAKRPAPGRVGIEIPIDRLEGKLKASQDEAMEDRLGTVRGLRRRLPTKPGGWPISSCRPSRPMRPVDRDGRLPVESTGSGTPLGPWPRLQASGLKLSVRMRSRRS